jgi:hypothetical protein
MLFILELELLGDDLKRGDQQEILYVCKPGDIYVFSDLLCPHLKIQDFYSVLTSDHEPIKLKIFGLDI